MTDLNRIASISKNSLSQNGGGAPAAELAGHARHRRMKTDTG